MVKIAHLGHSAHTRPQQNGPHAKACAHSVLKAEYEYEIPFDESKACLTRLRSNIGRVSSSGLSIVASSAGAFQLNMNMGWSLRSAQRLGRTDAPENAVVVLESVRRAGARIRAHTHKCAVSALPRRARLRYPPSAIGGPLFTRLLDLREPAAASGSANKSVSQTIVVHSKIPPSNARTRTRAGPGTRIKPKN
jgi:hypothetical protein